MFRKNKKREKGGDFLREETAFLTLVLQVLTVIYTVLCILEKVHI